ncbi:MAG TPA: pyruvate dehydrogenase (acetyl-transferring), homodimeric type, partial [Gemmatimonadales bacterium]
MSTEIRTPLNWYGGGVDTDVDETEEWLSALEEVVELEGGERGQYLLKKLLEKGYEKDVTLPFTGNTPYINTIPVTKQPPYPGDRTIERRIKSIVRWNAMALVVRANKKFPGIGGHISTFASSATLYQVGFHHFFRGRGPDGFGGDLVFFQGHGSPGIYAQAFLGGRISAEQMENFRRELERGGGLSSYPHPWLMPDFWEFPTVSMGLSPITAIYQAKFNRYLEDRGILETNGRRVWAFLGDGETDEPESLGAITLAARERLDNLTFVINCNLQRLDGPVRANFKIVQELEAQFRGAGWNVVKSLWGSAWDELFQLDTTGALVRRLREVPDAQVQTYQTRDAAYIRQDFFGKDPALAEMAKLLSDDKILECFHISRGGHEARKVYAAYKAAVEHK